ncbi:acyl carrier protein [Butyrivibrio hungatei DSM 14810]|uniref:Acyl carrier protein n=1 Tax=Butyrivibrio hungatei DSM 14810 TaxID=1121132 RepID=A0A1M7T4W4_9FIRM|nr:acyl carrier protein [Butyrivibrio hungatei]SHN65773.1 acyl carrier protein [Butyrivibrio hungatei DSM 14810]
MSREEVLSKLQKIIRDVFDDEDIEVSEETVATDVDGWDSLAHITLIGTIEDEFDVKFAMKEVVNLKKVGNIIDLIMEQL